MKVTKDYFEYTAKIIIYILAALLPVFFIPVQIGIETGREAVFTGLIVVGAICWFLSILKNGEIRLSQSPILYAAVLALVVFGASTIFSSAPWASVFWADAVAEKFSTLIAGLLLMVMAGSVLRSSREAGRTIFILLFSGTISGLLTLLQIFFDLSPVYRVISPLVQGKDFNVIGTVNALALFYTTLLIMSVGIILSGPLKEWKLWLRYALSFSIAVFFMNLLVINYRTVWVVLLGSSIFLLGFKIRNVYTLRRKLETGFSDGPGFNWQYLTVIALLVLSVVMILVRVPVISSVGFAPEAMPSLKATLDIAGSLFKEGPKAVLLGSGPATFGLEWSKYKDVAINQTVFWAVRFNQGFSWFATLPTTVGLLGLLATLTLAGVSLFLFLKKILTSTEAETALTVGLFMGFVSMLLTAFLYPANFSLVLTWFLITGLLTFLLASRPVAESVIEEGVSPVLWKDITAYSLRFESPWAAFLSSLFFTLAISVGVAALYFEVGHLRALIAQQAGYMVLNKGDVDGSIPYFEKASLIEENNFRHFQALAQARVLQIRNLVQRAAAGENVQDKFQSTVVQATQNSQRAIQLYPAEFMSWRIQGGVYETIIPFIPGSERLAFDSYKKAIELDPVNATVWVDLGRAYLVFADRMRLAVNQAVGSEREQLSQVVLASLREAEGALRKAVEKKADLAVAHFLLAQTEIRLGDIELAIKSTENAKLVVPFDIGIAFQLGLLYYQSNNLGRAQAEFERAISINNNYANARYFLGIIYDRNGDKAKAIKEFEHILTTNPDNQEVKLILINLRSGKSVLAGIVPPAEPPEKRKEAPVP